LVYVLALVKSRHHPIKVHKDDQIQPITGLYLIIFLDIFLIAWWWLFTEAKTCSSQ